LKPIAEQGYLIVAQNSKDVDYVDCARTLVKTIRYWHPDAQICLLTNEEVGPDVLFDYVHKFPFPLNEQNPYANDWQVFQATPFRETIKLEADMMITSAIDYWWTMLRNRDLVVSTGCRDWKDQRAVARHYRKVFDANDLPDVYNAITYWRRSATAQEFFATVRNIFENWPEFRKLLKFPEDIPSTDVVYAMAANIIGPELCTMPFADYPRIVHMKRHIAGTQRERWQDELVWEYKDYLMRVNSIAQWGAFHYRVKDLRDANR
jgi:hypothetical protein